MTTLEAVIEIGSTGIRLAIAEVNADGFWSFIDHSERSVPLGWDVFTSSQVSRNTILECLRILDRFKEQIQSWNIDDAHISIFATSALRLANNRDAVLDRIRIKTGFDVKIIDGLEENQLMYLAVLHALKNQMPRFVQYNSIILDIGGGSTEIMLFDRGQMVAAHSFRLGTVIIEQYIKSMMGSLNDARRFLTEFITNTGGSLNNELNLAQIQQFITIGPEAQIAAKAAGTVLNDTCSLVERDAFCDFVDSIQTYSTEEVMAKFKISFAEARSLGINLLTYKLFINLTAAKQILVVKASIREGILTNKYTAPNTELQENFLSQVTASALNLCRKYRADIKHAEYVCDTALKFYDALQSEHGFKGKERLLLEIASLLHDVGSFIQNEHHEIHSQYIISNSEIFGLQKDEMNIVAAIARYHKGAKPNIADERFYALPPQDRIKVQKLAAILRIADAFDRGHTQRISKFSIDLSDDTMRLQLAAPTDTSLEKNAMAEKADLFEEIFGYKVVLE